MSRGGRQHLVLIGLGDRRLHRAQFAEAVEEALGDALELLHRARQHRVGRGARGQRAEHRFAQQQDLGEQFRARLVDVAMDQVLQPAGFAFQQRQDLVGFPHLADVVPGRTEHLARRSRSCAASTSTTAEFSAAIDRMRQRIGTARTSWTMRTRAARGEARRPFRAIVLPGCGQGQLTPPCEFVRSVARPRDRAAPWRRFRPSPLRTACGRYRSRWSTPAASACLRDRSSRSRHFSRMNWLERSAASRKIFRSSADKRLPGLVRHHQHFRAHRVFGEGVVAGML